jgi:serine/threonine protein kinase
MDNYIMFQKLGSGTYGNIFRGMQLHDNKPVAIKVEDEAFLLEKEYMVYVYLWKYIQENKAITLNIPKVFKFSKVNNKSYMVLEELTYSLDYLYIGLNHTFSFSMLIWLTVKGLEQLRELHTLGIIHRDLKPDNFGIKKGKLYLFDFGLANQFISSSGNHVEEKQRYPLIGTLRYASINTHKGYEQSRRDDLESFWYMLMFFFTGSLPWAHITSKSKDKNEETLRYKECLNIDSFCKDVPIEYSRFYKYIRELGFTEKPDYNFWIEQFSFLCADLKPDKIDKQKKTLKKIKS